MQANPPGIIETIQQNRIDRVLATDADLTAILGNYIEVQLNAGVSCIREPGKTYVSAPLALNDPRCHGDEAHPYVAYLKNVRRELVESGVTGETRYLTVLNTGGHYVAIEATFKGSNLMSFIAHDSMSNPGLQAKLQAAAQSLLSYGDATAPVQVQVISTGEQEHGDFELCGYYSARRLLSKMIAQNPGCATPEQHRIVTSVTPDALCQATFDAVRASSTELQIYSRQILPPATPAERQAQIHSDEAFARALQDLYNAAPTLKKEEEQNFIEQAKASGTLPRTSSSTPFRRSIGLGAAVSPEVPISPVT